MRIPWIAIACLALTGCAAQTTAPSAAQTETALPPDSTGESAETSATPESDTAAAQSAPEVSIESFAGVAACRRYVPTGSRIAGKRCESSDTKEDRIAYEQTRKDIEEMRRQQMYQERAAEAAMAEAFRRGPGN